MTKPNPVADYLTDVANSITAAEGVARSLVDGIAEGKQTPESTTAALLALAEALVVIRRGLDLVIAGGRARR